jgi:hypothetical protein
MVTKHMCSQPDGKKNVVFGDISMWYTEIFLSKVYELYGLSIYFKDNLNHSIGLTQIVCG